MIDLHIHSKYSFDSILSPKKILKVAKKKGLKGIAVTDHNTVKGGLEAKKINDDNKFTVIVGTEIQTEVGDIIGLQITEEIKSRIAIEVVDEIKDQGGLVILPHPFRGHKLNRSIIEQMDGIEVFNGRSTLEENYNAFMLAKEYKIPFTAGSDAHFSSEIGGGAVLFNNKNYDFSIFPLTNNEANIYRVSGNNSYLKDASQIIKSIKTGELERIPRQTISFTYHILKNHFKI